MTAAPTAPVPPETPPPTPSPPDTATPASVAYSGLQGPSGDDLLTFRTADLDEAMVGIFRAWSDRDAETAAGVATLAAERDQLRAQLADTWRACNAAYKALAAVTTERDQLREAGDALSTAGPRCNPDVARAECPYCRALDRWLEVTGQ